LREKEIKRIVEHYGNLKIYMVFDETTDAVGRSILNILVGECSESERKRPSLIKSVELVKTAERQLGHGRVDANLDLLFFLFNSTILIKKF
jgi:hypothetical protein